MSGTSTDENTCKCGLTEIMSSKTEELLSVKFLIHSVFQWGSSEHSEWQSEYA